MIMGIDHGYYAIKTRHFKFPAGVAVYSHEPYTLKNTLQVNGKYYVCGTGRQPILRDKTINDNYYILTLAAIAMELRYRGLPAESSVTLAAGLPLARYGRDKKPFTEYLLRNGQPVTFRFEGERYKIKIEDVKLFPQGYSAIAVRPDLVKNEPSILLTIEGNGDGNGQVPPGQHEDEDGTIVNPGGNVAPGLNRGEKIDKPANPNKPEKPNKPGSEDKEDKKVNKAQQGTHIYTYDELNRMVTSDVSKVFTNYTYDTLGNLVLETVKNKSVDYEYNELNQLVKRTTTENETFTYSYDKRGNRVAETGKKESREYVYDATNRLVEGTNWKGDKSAYTYNGLGLRVNNLVTTHAGKTYDRDYVIDYTSPENDDLYVYAMGNGQLEYEQRHVYAGSERLEQITEKGTGGWERTLYVHEDVMGNTRYYTKATGQNFAELQYDAWGQPVSPNKLVNNDHGNYVFATFTGHIYDTTLDVYFAEARFYDAITRTWMAMDPIKSGLNWYSYVAANPTTFFDPFGTIEMSIQNRDNLDVEGDGEPAYAYVRISPESFAWFAGFTVVDSLTLGIPTIIINSGLEESGGYSALFEGEVVWRDLALGPGPDILEKAPDVVDAFSKTTIASHLGGKTIGTLTRGANVLKGAAPILSTVSAVSSFANLANGDRVLNDDAMLSMMAEAGWIVESMDGSGQAVYFADPQKRLSEKEQQEYFDDLVERVERGYAFFETEQAEFFRTHSTFNKAYSMASDYEIYMSIRNLPAAEREKKLQDYLRTYEGKLLGSFYAENDSIELTASQRNDLNLMLREYKQRLNTLDERYRGAFHAFKKFVCG